jgi:hypothetical protein
VVALLFFRPLNHRAAQHFCGNEFSMADNSLQNSKNSQPSMWHRTPPASLVR